jgi:hypothetical protein
MKFRRTEAGCALRHLPRRKIMTFIPLKARAGIAGLTIAAALLPFVWANSAKALAINFLDGEASDALFGMVQVTENGVLVTPPVQIREFIQTRSIQSTDANASVGVGGIIFVEPGTNIVSDILQVTITGVADARGQNARQTCAHHRTRNLNVRLDRDLNIGG